MEEIKDLENPVENVVPENVTEEPKETAEKQTSVVTEEPAKVLEPQNVEGDACKSGNGHKKCCDIAHWILDGVMLAAIIALFILHFCGGKETVKPVDPALAGNGDVIYVNIDSINDQYEMVSLLTDSIEAEKQRQTIVFQNRQKALEQKLTNYQNNVQTGQLTAQQAQYAEQSLQQESQRLQSDYATAVEALEARYTAALSQIADSLKAASLRVNKKYNASYVFSYGNGGQILCADPTKDVTQEVLADLNKPFKKAKKKK